ncbi:MAG: hypothetical protein JW981_10575 [Anaerolineae bacterium]|nr:hypothetical protein [Anaerolineae bacterium]
MSKTQWAVLIYIAAHNNLERLGQRSLKQILDVGSKAQVKLAVLYDRPDSATRYLVGEPGTAVVKEQLSDFDSGDPDALLETIHWAFEQNPAEHYALMLWSHGSGWQPEDRKPVRGTAPLTLSGWAAEELAQIAREVRRDNAVSTQEAERSAQAGSMALFRTTLAQILRQDNPTERAICFDDGSGHSLDTLELGRVVRETQDIIGQPLDLLGMDACVMATLEVAYQVRQHVRTLVASEELVPGYSWPYDTILGALQDAPKMSAQDLSALIVQHYVDYYTAHPPVLNRGDVTKIALNLAQIESLTQAVDALAGALLVDMDTQADVLWSAQRATQTRETLNGRRRSNKFNYHLWDIGTVAAYLAEHSENSAVQTAAQIVINALQPRGTVIAGGHHGDWLDGIGGVSIYAPPPGRQRISPYYAEVALARDTRWGEMLQAYHAQLA